MSEESSRWEMKEKLGSGSYATVYRGLDRELNREVAIKVIRDEFREDPSQLEQYWQEAQLVASLHHPQIITIFDIDRSRGWLILELMKSNLSELMAGRPMSVKSLTAALNHALRALEYLHERDIVHGDIKPSNLMFDHRKHVKVGDFGLAHRVTGQDGSILKGTTKYIAPEVISDEFGPVGPASDLYSLGFTAYEFLCGSNFDSLFPGMEAFGRNKQMAWMMWHVSKERRIPPLSKVLEGVPDGLHNVIDRLCQKDQSLRYRSAREVLDDLDEISQIPSKTGAFSAADKEKKKVKLKDDPRKKRLLIAAGALFLSVVMSMVMIFMSGDSIPIGKKKKGLKVGIVREVFVKQHKIVLENPQTGVPVEIDVGKTPRLFLRNQQKYILLNELQKGDRIQFKTSKTSTNIGSLELIISRPVESLGRVKQISRGQSQLIISVHKGETRGDIPLQVTKTSQFQLNNNKCRFRDLKVGDRVTIKHLEKLDSTGQLLQSLTALRLVNAIGTISEINLDKNKLTINRPIRLLSETMLLSLSKNCSIKRDGKQINLKDVKVTDRIRFQYDSAIHSIEVAAGQKVTKSYIVAVDETKQQLIIRAIAGAGDRIYALVKGCEITLGQQPATLKDLRLNDRVTISHHPSKDEQTPRKTFSVDAVRNINYDRAAIIIGTGVFKDSYLTPLPHVEEDLSLMHDVLMDRYAVPKDYMLDLRETKKADIQEELTSWLTNMKSHTQLIVYVAGHAYTNSDGKVYLAPFDFKFDHMEKTGISLSWLIQTLNSSASQNKTLLLDCTHAGMGADLKQEFSAEKIFEKLPSPSNSLHLIGSCQTGERGMLTANRQHGLFARIAADALGGAADPDKDVRISTTDLFNYLQKKMKTYESKAGQKQTPILVEPR